MEQPLISVIVPIYKVEQFLPRCVDSLLAQTYSNLEIILVDDGSPDRCGEICEEYAKRDSRIKVIHKENGGLSSARNAGIDISTGDYLAFVDSDDWLDPDCYEKLNALAQKYHSGFVCAGRYDVDGDTGRETIGLCPKKEEVISGEETASRIFRWEHMDSSVCDKLFAKALFENIRFPLNITSEDIPVTYRLALFAGRCVLGNFPVYHYYHRSGSISMSDFSDKSFSFLNTALNIYSQIAQEHPEILDAARYLKVRALGWTVQMLEISSASVRKKFASECRKYRRLLRKETSFFLRCPWFTSTQKRDYFMIAFYLYRMPRMLYHFIKRA